MALSTSANVSEPSVIRRILTTPSTWAVVGLSTDATRTAYGVARWMHDALGHRIIPVHPRAQEVWDEQGYPNLTQIPNGTIVTVVDCFVNSTLVGAIVDEAIAIGAGAVWLQLDVIDEAAAERAVAAGLHVVMDRCPAIEGPRIPAF